MFEYYVAEPECTGPKYFWKVTCYLNEYSIRIYVAEVCFEKVASYFFE